VFEGVGGFVCSTVDGCKSAEAIRLDGPAAGTGVATELDRAIASREVCGAEFGMDPIPVDN
jgi:hypothetical protein